MRPTVIATAPPKGGFGNRVITFLSLRAIANRFSVGLLTTNLGDRKWIPKIHKPHLAPLRWRRLIEFDAEISLKPDFCSRAREIFDNHGSMRARGPFLGDVFATFEKSDHFRPPRHQFNVCKSHSAALNGQPLAVLHIRGGDFQNWDSAALLPKEYYFEAVDYLASQDSDYLYRVVTDDPLCETVLAVSKHLKERGVLLGSEECETPFSCDFASMAGASTLVSSPSTFAISAGLLGGSRIVHNRQWVENRVSRGELFWARVSSNTLPGYAVDQLI